MPLLRLITGIALLFLGRKLYWLFVAGVGFILAVRWATPYLRNQPEWLVLLIALGAGLVGALLAYFLQRVAVGLAGFAAGGTLLFNFLETIGWQSGRLNWLPFLVGGILGAILVSLLFDWALILLSSLSGAILTTQTLSLPALVSWLVFAAFLVAGILVQTWLLRRERAAHERRPQLGPQE